MYLKIKIHDCFYSAIQSTMFVITIEIVNDLLRDSILNIILPPLFKYMKRCDMQIWILWWWLIKIYFALGFSLPDIDRSTEDDDSWMDGRVYARMGVAKRMLFTVPSSLRR